VRVDLPPLAAGAYGLRYKVLAVDGHVTESVLRFTVRPAR
jgi:methionine-rich copper-binding protein CopC